MSQKRTAGDRRVGWRDLAVVAAAAVLTASTVVASDRGLWLYPRVFTSVFLPGLSFGLRGLLLPAAGCLLLGWRRRWPVPVALVLVVMCAFVPVIPAVAIALFTVAARCPVATTRWVTAFALLPVLLYLVTRWSFQSAEVASAVTGALLVGGAVGWGLFVRALRERAVRAESESALRAERARRREREAIAREMHDVLAHRLSLLSVHAGALEFHPHAPPEQVREAAAVIRDSAARALEDLQHVLGVLRTPLDPGAATRTEPPQPTLRDLTRLIEENREAGTRVEVEVDLTDADSLSDFTSRTVYRIVQEALTNARKHAPGEAVHLSLAGTPRDGLTLDVTNGLPAAPPTDAPPGAGQGLIGMSERVALAGGTFEHSRTGGRYRVTAWLPWTA
ncbi:sensor histidine kinase [Streptomyces sp.]|uniref:sensor histidine kinase n=1 Tax=Streptomyces sp. TaxID=1931 RepID=UPI0025FE229F|nr:sensor histidine kinase [Streptomyces sp.]